MAGQGKQCISFIFDPVSSLFAVLFRPSLQLQSLALWEVVATRNPSLEVTSDIQCKTPQYTCTLLSFSVNMHSAFFFRFVHTEGIIVLAATNKKENLDP